MAVSKLNLFLILAILFVVLLGNLNKLVAIPVLVLIIFIISNYFTSFRGSSWAPVGQKTVKKMVDEAKLKKGALAYDIGSGDGRIVIHAAKKGATVRGIEIEPLKWLLSNLMIRIRKIRNANIILGDFFKKDISDADTVFIYLPQETVNKLQNKLKRLKKGTKIISCSSVCKDLKLIKELKKDKIYVYQIK